MKFVPYKVSRGIGRSILKTKMNSPHIFFGVGVVGVITGTVLACRATLKLESTLDDIKNDFQNVEDTKPNVTQRQYNQDLGYVTLKSANKIGRLYGPSVIVSTVSIAALTGSHIQLTRRNAALTFTLAAVSKAYDEYRLRVQEEIGEGRELEIYRGVQEETVEIEGKKTKLTTTDPSKWSPYARIFDEYSNEWVKDPEYNRIFIECQQKYANDLLRSRGHVFLNEVYDSLGLERSRAGAVVGWVLEGDGDGYVDFGLFEATSSPFINNFERSIILDFNVDGVVYDKI